AACFIRAARTPSTFAGKKSRDCAKSSPIISPPAIWWRTLMALFEAKNLTKIYGGGLLNKGHNVALDDFSLTIPGDTPQITTIAGESGSGKTTLANLV